MTKKLKPDDTISLDMITYKDWYHILISATTLERYHPLSVSEEWCTSNCDGKWYRGFYREPERMYEAIYFELESDKVKFILWM